MTDLKVNAFDSYILLQIVSQPCIFISCTPYSIFFINFTLQIIKEQNCLEKDHYESIYDKIHSFGYIKVKEDNELLSKKYPYVFLGKLITNELNIIDK